MAGSASRSLRHMMAAERGSAVLPGWLASFDSAVPDDEEENETALHHVG